MNQLFYCTNNASVHELLAAATKFLLDITNKKSLIWSCQLTGKCSMIQNPMHHAEQYSGYRSQDYQHRMDNQASPLQVVYLLLVHKAERMSETNRSHSHINTLGEHLTKQYSKLSIALAVRNF